MGLGVLAGGLAVTAGCGGSGKNAGISAETLPKTVEGGWTLGDAVDVPESQWPEPARTLHAKRALNATYRGAQEEHVTFYDMPAAASAFELLQKWRPISGTVALQHKSLLLVVEPPSQEFVKALDKALP